MGFKKIAYLIQNYLIEFEFSAFKLSIACVCCFNNYNLLIAQTYLSACYMYL